MTAKFSLTMIHDAEVRRILAEDLPALTDQAMESLRWLRMQRDTSRLRAYESGELRRTRATGYLSEELKQPVPRYVMTRAVWETLCNIDAENPEQGVPNPELIGVFEGKGVTPAIMGSTLLGAFVALSAVWPELAAALASERREKIETDVMGFVTIQLDHASQSPLNQFCALVPVLPGKA